jgi:hypothetical protein
VSRSGCCRGWATGGRNDRGLYDPTGGAVNTDTAILDTAIRALENAISKNVVQVARHTAGRNVLKRSAGAPLAANCGALSTVLPALGVTRDLRYLFGVGREPEPLLILPRRTPLCHLDA